MRTMLDNVGQEVQRTSFETDLGYAAVKSGIRDYMTSEGLSAADLENDSEAVRNAISAIVLEKLSVCGGDSVAKTWITPEAVTAMSEGTQHMISKTFFGDTYKLEKALGSGDGSVKEFRRLMEEAQRRTDTVTGEIGAHSTGWFTDRERTVDALLEETGVGADRVDKDRMMSGLGEIASLYGSGQLTKDTLPRYFPRG